MSTFALYIFPQYNTDQQSWFNKDEPSYHN